MDWAGNLGHISGAINLPLNLFEFIYSMRLSNVDSQQTIIVYGRTFSRLYDDEVAFKLNARGHENVFILEGGLKAWRQNGYPIDS